MRKKIKKIVVSIVCGVVALSGIGMQPTTTYATGSNTVVVAPIAYDRYIDAVFGSMSPDLTGSLQYQNEAGEWQDVITLGYTPTHIDRDGYRSFEFANLPNGQYRYVEDSISTHLVGVTDTLPDSISQIKYENKHIANDNDVITGFTLGDGFATTYEFTAIRDINTASISPDKVDSIRIDAMDQWTYDNEDNSDPHVDVAGNSVYYDITYSQITGTTVMYDKHGFGPFDAAFFFTGDDILATPSGENIGGTVVVTTNNDAGTVAHVYDEHDVELKYETHGDEIHIQYDQNRDGWYYPREVTIVYETLGADLVLPELEYEEGGPVGEGVGEPQDFEFTLKVLTKSTYEGMDNRYFYTGMSYEFSDSEVPGVMSEGHSETARPAGYIPDYSVGATGLIDTRLSGIPLDNGDISISYEGGSYVDVTNVIVSNPTTGYHTHLSYEVRGTHIVDTEHGILELTNVKIDLNGIEMTDGAEVSVIVAPKSCFSFAMYDEDGQSYFNGEEEMDSFVENNLGYDSMIDLEHYTLDGGWVSVSELGYEPNYSWQGDNGWLEYCDLPSGSYRYSLPSGIQWSSTDVNIPVHGAATFSDVQDRGSDLGDITTHTFELTEENATYGERHVATPVEGLYKEEALNTYVISESTYENWDTIGDDAIGFTGSVSVLEEFKMVDVFVDKYEKNDVFTSEKPLDGLTVTHHSSSSASSTISIHVADIPEGESIVGVYSSVTNEELPSYTLSDDSTVMVMMHENVGIENIYVVISEPKGAFSGAVVDSSVMGSTTTENLYGAFDTNAFILEKQNSDGSWSEIPNEFTVDTSSDVPWFQVTGLDFGKYRAVLNHDVIDDMVFDGTWYGHDNTYDVSTSRFDLTEGGYTLLSTGDSYEFTISYDNIDERVYASTYDHGMSELGKKDVVVRVYDQWTYDNYDFAVANDLVVEYTSSITVSSKVAQDGFVKEVMSMGYGGTTIPNPTIDYSAYIVPNIDGREIIGVYQDFTGTKMEYTASDKDISITGDDTSSLPYEIIIVVNDDVHIPTIPDLEDGILVDDFVGTFGVSIVGNGMISENGNVKGSIDTNIFTLQRKHVTTEYMRSEIWENVDIEPTMNTTAHDGHDVIWFEWNDLPAGEYRVIYDTNIIEDYGFTGTWFDANGVSSLDNLTTLDDSNIGIYNFMMTPANTDIRYVAPVDNTIVTSRDTTEFVINVKTMDEDTYANYDEVVGSEQAVIYPTEVTGVVTNRIDGLVVVDTMTSNESVTLVKTADGVVDVTLHPAIDGREIIGVYHDMAGSVNLLDSFTNNNGVLSMSNITNGNFIIVVKTDEVVVEDPIDPVLPELEFEEGGPVGDIVDNTPEIEDEIVNEPVEKPTQESNVPQTGDVTNVFGMIGLFITSCIVLIRMKKRSNSI